MDNNLLLIDKNILPPEPPTPRSRLVCFLFAASLAVMVVGPFVGMLFAWYYRIAELKPGPYGASLDALMVYGLALVLIIGVLAVSRSLTVMLQSRFPYKESLVGAWFALASLMAIVHLCTYVTGLLYFSSPDASMMLALVFLAVAAGVYGALRRRPGREKGHLPASAFVLAATLAIQLPMVAFMGNTSPLAASAQAMMPAITAGIEGKRSHSGAHPYEAQRLRSAMAEAKEDVSQGWINHELLLSIESSGGNDGFHRERWLDLYRLAITTLKGSNFYIYHYSKVGSGPGVTFASAKGAQLNQACLASHPEIGFTATILGLITYNGYPRVSPACKEYISWVAFSAKPEDFTYISLEQWREKNIPAV